MRPWLHPTPACVSRISEPASWNLARRQRRRLQQTLAPQARDKDDDSDDFWAHSESLVAPKKASPEQRYNDLDMEDRHNLPLPPMLRTRDRTDRFSDFGFEPIMPKGIKRTLQEKERIAPFSLAFNRNPYAHALAVPARQCDFTKARLPRSCLLDFHLVQHEGEEGQDDQLELLPLGLLASLVRKKKDRQELKEDERQTREAWEEEAWSPAPKGSASYVLCRKDALEFVSENPKKRLSKFVVSRRVSLMLGQEREKRPLIWREDMADYVLDCMRKFVMKKLGWFLRVKRVPDVKGAVQTMPGNAGLERLDEVDDVICTLRMRPADPSQKMKIQQDEDAQGQQEGGTDYSGLEEENAQTSEQILQNVSEQPKGQEEELKALEGSVARSKELKAQQDHPESDIGDPPEPIGLSIPAILEAGERAEAQAQNDNRLVKDTDMPTRRSKTHKWYSGPWSRDENTSFIGQLHPLPPPMHPRILYFPTLRYRNRRVAAYNLPELLGEENARKLVENTVFRDSTYVTVTAMDGTVNFQMMLLKLQAYLAGEKKDAVRI